MPHPTLRTSIFSYAGQAIRRRGSNGGPIVTAEQLSRLSRDEMMDVFEQYRGMRNAWLRDHILNHRRNDILAAVLGLIVKKFHFRIMQHQARHDQTLVLAFRGAGKSTIGTELDSVGEVIRYRDIRIQFASKSSDNAKGFLRSARAHLEHHRLVEIFGVFKGEGAWSDTLIEVAGRRRAAKEPTISCLGLESTVVSKHYDIQYIDDLVDEDNSRTKYMRTKTNTFYYKTLDPCLEPPETVIWEGRKIRIGKRRVLGTRYHFDDHYGHLMKNELKGRALVIKATKERYSHKKGRIVEVSSWPEKFPVRFFRTKRKQQGTIIYNSQYMMDCEAMKGEIFQYDWCQVLSDEDYPPLEAMDVFGGADLAISEKDHRDISRFALAIIGRTRDTDEYYTLYKWEGRISFRKQLFRIEAAIEKWKPVRFGIESVAYQKAQYQEVKRRNAESPVMEVPANKDKTTNYWELSVPFEDGRWYFRRQHHAWLEHMVLQPGADHNDLADATFLAYRASKAKIRRKRRKEPGVM